MTIPTDEPVVNDRLDLEMLKRPHLWPGQGRTINLKTRDGSFALCQQARDGSYRVWKYIGGSYELEDKPIMFADAEGIVDAGWRVD